MSWHLMVNPNRNSKCANNIFGMLATIFYFFIVSTVLFIDSITTINNFSRFFLLLWHIKESLVYFIKCKRNVSISP